MPIIDSLKILNGFVSDSAKAERDTATIPASDAGPLMTAGPRRRYEHLLLVAKTRLAILPIEGVPAGMMFSSYSPKNPVDSVEVVNRSGVAVTKRIGQHIYLPVPSKKYFSTNYGGERFVTNDQASASHVLTRAGRMPEACFKNVDIMATVLGLMIAKLRTERRIPGFEGFAVSSSVRVPGETLSKGPQYESAHNDGRALDIFPLIRSNGRSCKMRSRQVVVQETFEAVCRDLGIKRYWSYFKPNSYTHIEISSAHAFSRRRSSHRGSNKQQYSR